MGFFGRTLEAELERAGSDAKSQDEADRKREMVLRRFIGEDDKPQRGLYADPATMFK